MTLSQSNDEAKALDLEQHNSEAFKSLGSIIAVLRYPDLSNVMFNNHVLAAAQNNNMQFLQVQLWLKSAVLVVTFFHIQYVKQKTVIVY